MLMPAAAAAMAFVLGAAAGLSMAPTAAETARPETDAREGLVDVLVARRVVPAGTELGYAVVTRSQMPARFVTGSMVRPEHVGQLVGEMVLVTILEGEPILWSYLAAGASESVCDWIREANERRADE